VVRGDPGSRKATDERMSVSAPILVQLVLRDDRIVGIDSFEVPRDGDTYAPDVRRLFPRSVADVILRHYDDIRVPALVADFVEGPSQEPPR
jgi:hypothetical protein